MTDNDRAEIIERGMRCLFDHLGPIETEKFISTILSERFDYTQWRIEAFEDESVHELNENAAAYVRENPFKPKRKQLPI